MENASKDSRILCVGPCTPPITGQSIAFTKAYNSMRTQHTYLVNHNLTNLGTVQKIIKTLQHICKIIWIISTKHIDTVYFTCSRSILGSVKDIVLIMVAHVAGARVINHLHGADFKHFYGSLPKWYRWVVTTAYNKIAISVVLLESMKDQFSDFPDMQLEVVHNFYDHSLDSLQGQTTYREDGSLSILYMSNIMVSKGIFDLIEAFLIVQHTYPDITLHIAGAYVADKYASQKEVESRFLKAIHGVAGIVYHGVVTGQEKKEILTSTDIFVLPSYFVSEASPISAIEAMATGHALILGQHNYLPDLCHRSNISVPVKSPRRIVEALEGYIKNRDSLIRTQKENSNYAREYFSEEHYVNQLQSIIGI